MYKSSADFSKSRKTIYIMDLQPAARQVVLNASRSRL